MTSLYDTWHFYNEEVPSEHRSDMENPSVWSSEAEFVWAEDVATVEQELWKEGVVRLGKVSETYLGDSQ